MSNFKKSIILLALIFIIGCTSQQATIDDRPQTIEPTVYRPSSVVTKTPVRFDTASPVNASPTRTIAPVTATLSIPQIHVTITAVDGNLYIRRGPNTKYSRIGVLKEGMSAEVIGQDVLSKWVQINIPNSESTGWVSIQTEFSRIDGDLKQIPNFTFTDYPLPAYIKNCTEHELFIEPGEYYLYDVFTNGEYLNEVKVDAGVYYVYDASLPDLPLVETIDLQENETAFITVDGSGAGHKCP